MMLSTLLLVPLVAIIGVGILDLSGAIVAITAVTCFLGGLLRILYALLMEEAIPPTSSESSAYPPPGMPQFARPVQNPALPPASVNTAAWRPRPNTAEIYQPPSVTENTTRLLDKDDPNNR
jgi:heme A synthase